MEEKKETTEEIKAAEEAHEEGGKFLKNRRQFLGALAGVVGAVGATQVIVPLLGSFTPVQKGKPEPVTLNLGDIPEGGFVSARYGSTQFLAFNRKSGIECISLVCTHLGCLVKWDPEANSGKGQFKCPCHDGGFDEHGVQKFGPPPAPLELLPFKLVGDKLIVGGE